MEENKGAFVGRDVVVDPDFFFRNIGINQVVATFGKIDVKNTTNQAAINKPDAKTFFSGFEFFKMNFGGVSDPLAVFNFSQIMATTAFGTFGDIGGVEGNGISGSIFQSAALGEGGVDKKT